MSDELKTKLFTSGSLVAKEQADKGGDSADGTASGGGDSLGIGSLKGGQGL
jgi:hypothetical protein